MKEKEFQRDVTKAATDLGWLWYHTHDSRRSVPGFPDLVLVRRGRIIFAELKTDKGKLSAAQECWGAELECCEGIEYYVWRPRDWDWVLEILSTLVARF